MDPENTNTNTPEPAPAPAPEADRPADTPAPAAKPDAAPAPAPEAEKPVDTPAPAAKPESAKPEAAKPERRRTLLEEADEPEAAADPDAAAAEGAAPDEKLAKFTEGIRALDLGDGVRFDDEAFSAIAPELMELCGGEPSKAERLVRKYVEGELARARAAQEAQDAFVTELRNQCRQRWGADVKAVARTASRGGRAVFGDRIWNEMKGIETFANNPDIMERLAMIGRRVSEDGGAVHPAGQEAEDTRDVIARMYGGVK